MPDARLIKDGDYRTIRTAANTAAGELWQDADGLACFQDAGAVKASGTDVSFRKTGEVTVVKVTGVAFVDGAEVYWDHSANNATYKPVNDRDFYIGTAVGDTVSADSSMVVNLNNRQRCIFDSRVNAYQSVIVGTPAAGGFGYPVPLGGSLIFELTATNEAQKVDALGVRGFSPLTANAIIDFVFRVISDGAGTNPDVSIGVASGTDATNADTIAESTFLHLNGNSTTIYAESDDGSNEVAATDTTYTYTESATYTGEVYGTIDMRDPASVKWFINGVATLTGTTFNVSAAAATWYPLIHVEKSSSTDTYKIAVDKLTVRTGEQ